MDEFSFIDSIKQDVYFQPSVLKGIGDDAAVFRANNQDIITAVDTLVEDVHFSRDTMAPFDVGYRALAVNISDLAAMGAAPAFYMVSIVIPEDWSVEEIDEIYSGMKELAKQYRMDLIGGDTVSGKELVVSVSVFGLVPPDKSRYRSLAKPGDVLFVTGTLGDAQAGLEYLLGKHHFDEAVADYFISRHRQPDPRVAFALQLQSLKRVALNDISDGIASESNEIAAASGVDLHIKYEDLPRVEYMNGLEKEVCKPWMLSGGEDFELLGAVPEKDWEAVQQAAEASSTRVTKIGSVSEKKATEPVVFLYEENEKSRLTKSGYTHLRQDR
ncbi:thiamine-monophosphate kinase [Thalassobacillus devorans]|uniref:Thiamine-monophosphate kinase n=1 Tax=Thalassobacillus devorans TaxID=279813 RepID=A0ABQ1PH32_9BACI|nr:thiamine-phosphate kinase [Thalassobacillus devorans]NIK29966.1 thiamine-monophosphate kinase [Thalassobacillus devorans]GGC97248.1 thiamine-monophosphate kinase [Thalassobacillus devorans]